MSDLQDQLETLRLLHDNLYGVHDEDPWDVAYEAAGSLIAAVEAVARVADRLHELSESPIGDAGTRVSRGEASLWITAALEDKLLGAANRCECPWTPEHMWFRHYGAIEPGSTQEYNPECPEHGSTERTPHD